MEATCVDDLSSNIAEMQTTVSPYSAGSVSLATTLAGEIHRLRFVLANAFGWTDWYLRDSNIDFNHTATGIQGSGLGRHVTAIALHTWSGSVRWPALTSVEAHTSGIFYPAAHHLALGFDATSDSGRFGSGQTNARTYFAFHATAMTIHHTAALRFAHSTAGMNNGQYGHVTALRISRVLGDGAPNSFGFQEGNDQLIFGHITSLLAFEGGAYIFRTTASQARTAGVQIDIPGAMATTGATGATLRIGAATTGATGNNAFWVDDGNVRFDGSIGMGVTSAGSAGSIQWNATADTGPSILGTAATLRFKGGTTDTQWANQANSVTTMSLTDAGILLLGTTVTTSGGAGDIILPNTTGDVRFVNAAGTDTIRGMFLDSSNIVNIGTGSSAANALRIRANAVDSQLVDVGAVDSGGAGFRLLRVPN